MPGLSRIHAISDSCPPWLAHFILLWQIDPELETMQHALGDLWHLAVDYTYEASYLAQRPLNSSGLSINLLSSLLDPPSPWLALSTHLYPLSSTALLLLR